MARVKNHLNPKPSPISKRFEFSTRCQERRETVDTFVAALRKIAEHCDYGNMFNDMLHNCIVCGVQDKGIQSRLLQEVGLTYTKALDIACAAETAERDAKRLQEDKMDCGSPVNRVGKYPKSFRMKDQSLDAQEGDCYRCGGKHSSTRRSCP